MGDSSPANPTEMSDCKPSWPRFSLVISVFLWLLAWEVIVWFVPAQPRLAIRISCNDDSDLEISENLAGFSPDGKMVVTTLERITTLTGLPARKEVPFKSASAKAITLAFAFPMTVARWLTAPTSRRKGIS